MRYMREKRATTKSGCVPVWHQRQTCVWCQIEKKKKKRLAHISLPVHTVLTDYYIWPWFSKYMNSPPFSMFLLLQLHLFLNKLIFLQGLLWRSWPTQVKSRPLKWKRENVKLIKIIWKKGFVWIGMALQYPTYNNNREKEGAKRTKDIWELIKGSSTCQSSNEGSCRPILFEFHKASIKSEGRGVLCLFCLSGLEL